MKRIWAWTLPCVLTVAAATAQDANKPNPDNKDHRQPTKERGDQPKGEQPKTDRDMRDKRNMQDASADQPGAEHKNLNAFVGTWQVTGTCWKEGPQSQGEPVSGTVNSQWILGNRFVECRARMNEGNQSVEGIGMMGYDNGQKKYSSTWQDSKCTSIKMESGDYDAASKTFTFKGDGKDKDGKAVQCRRTLKVVSDTEHVMTAYVTEQGQPEKKVAELSFRRSGERTDRGGAGERNSR